MARILELSKNDVAILERAAKLALLQAAERQVSLDDGEIAAKLFEAFWSGERDPARLAQAVFTTRMLH